MASVHISYRLRGCVHTSQNSHTSYMVACVASVQYHGYMPYTQSEAYKIGYWPVDIGI